VGRSYADNFGLQVALVRLFSVYGAGLEKQLIWDICCKLVAGASYPLLLGGTGAEIRDWLHVSDAAKLLWLAKETCGTRCEIINGGTGIGTAIREIAERVCRAWKVPAEVRFSGIARPGDPESLVADIARARAIGFEPAAALSDGIQEAVEWFRANRGDSSPTAGPHRHVR
jgi:UDP-glucose 4-epimerase